jgi:hypothetical protein
MTQSTDPKLAPKTKSAAVIEVASESVANSEKAELITTVDTTRTRRHPNRDDDNPTDAAAASGLGMHAIHFTSPDALVGELGALGFTVGR